MSVAMSVRTSQHLVMSHVSKTWLIHTLLSPKWLHVNHPALLSVGLPIEVLSLVKQDRVGLPFCRSIWRLRQSSHPFSKRICLSCHPIATKIEKHCEHGLAFHNTLIPVESSSPQLLPSKRQRTPKITGFEGVGRQTATSQNCTREKNIRQLASYKLQFRSNSNLVLALATCRF